MVENKTIKLFNLIEMRGEFFFKKSMKLLFWFFLAIIYKSLCMSNNLSPSTSSLVFLKKKNMTERKNSIKYDKLDFFNDKI